MGYTKSAQHRLNLSKALKGRKKSDEHKKNWRASMVKHDYKGVNNPNYIHGLSMTPEMSRLYEMRRLHRKKSLGGHFTLEEWTKKKEMFDYRCLWCEKKEPEIKLSADHRIPISKGGSSNIENIQPLCRNCNSKKRDRFIIFTPYNTTYIW